MPSEAEKQFPIPVDSDRPHPELADKPIAITCLKCKQTETATMPMMSSGWLTYPEGWVQWRTTGAVLCPDCVDIFENWLESDAEQLEAAIIEAVLLERQRCAEVVDRWMGIDISLILNGRKAMLDHIKDPSLDEEEEDEEEEVDIDLQPI